MALQLGPVIGQIGGAQVEEHPVSTSVAYTWTPVLTVTPAGRALVAIMGVVGSVSGSRYVQLRIDGRVSADFGNGDASHAVVVEASSTVEVRYSYTSNTTTFDGVVYVVPLPD